MKPQLRAGAGRGFCCSPTCTSIHTWHTYMAYIHGRGLLQPHTHQHTYHMQLCSAGCKRGALPDVCPHACTHAQPLGHALTRHRRRPGPLLHTPLLFSMSATRNAGRAVQSQGTPAWRGWTDWLVQRCLVQARVRAHVPALSPAHPCHQHTTANELGTRSCAGREMRRSAAAAGLEYPRVWGKAPPTWDQYKTHAYPPYAPLSLTAAAVATIAGGPERCEQHQQPRPAPPRCHRLRQGHRLAAGAHADAHCCASPGASTGQRAWSQVQHAQAGALPPHLTYQTAIPPPTTVPIQQPSRPDPSPTHQPSCSSPFNHEAEPGRADRGSGTVACQNPAQSATGCTQPVSCHPGCSAICLLGANLPAAQCTLPAGTDLIPYENDTWQAPT